MRKSAAKRLIWRMIGALVLLFALYGAAGMIGGAIPRNAGWREARDGVRIYVDDNGVHTGLIVPVDAAGIDWRQDFAASDLKDPRYAGFDHVEIGWGERAFYVETPTWADVHGRTVLAAAIGSDRTLIHVDWLPEPMPGEATRAITLTPDEYRRLAAFVRATLVARGAHLPGYAAADAFYEARGRYSAIETCNAWTGDALRAAGVRIGWWTPFPVTVMGWFAP